MMSTMMSSPGSQQLETILRGVPMSVAPGTLIGNEIFRIIGVTDIGGLIGIMKDLDITGELIGTTVYPYQNQLFGP